MSRKSKDNWINTVVKSLKDKNEKLGVAVLEECGRQCCRDNGMLEKAKALRLRIAKLDDDEIFDLIRAELFDHDSRVHKDSGMIYVEYDKCLCNLRDDDMYYDDYICECTKGYTKALFETVYKKQADVTILQTVLRGDQKCLLAIRVH